MQWLLAVAHGASLVTHAAAALVPSLRKDWHPLDAVAPLRDAGTPAPPPGAAALPPDTAAALARLRSAPLPFHHVRNRAGLVVHALCICLALMACLRVLPQAEREWHNISRSYFHADPPLPSVQQRGSAGGIVFDVPAVGSSSGRSGPETAEDLVPLQRGGRRSVQEIMEGDVAHLLTKNKAQTTKQQQQQQQRNPVQPRAGDSSSNDDGDDGSALIALLFHVLALLLSTAHMLFYSSWVRIDPRGGVDGTRRWRVPDSLGLSRHAFSHFVATTFTAHLMLLCLCVALGCLLRAEVGDTNADGGDPDSALLHWMLAPGQEDDEVLVSRLRRQLSPATLLTGCMYLPFFLLHAARFVLNALLWWRFKSFFPHIGLVRKRRRGGSKNDERGATTGSKNTTAKQLAKKRRDAATATAASAEEEEAEEFDMSDLGTLASFADASSADGAGASAEDGPASATAAFSVESVHAALEVDPSGDTLMAPSALMAKLRATPKLRRMLEEQERLQQRQRKEARQAAAAPVLDEHED